MERKAAGTVRDEIAFILVDYMDNRTTSLFLFNSGMYPFRA